MNSQQLLIAFGILCICVGSKAQAHSTSLVNEYHMRKVALEMLDRLYNKFKTASHDSDIRSLYEQEFISSFNRRYQNAYTWLYYVTTQNRGHAGLNLLDAGMASLKVMSSNSSVDYFSDIESFGELARKVELRHAMLVGKPEPFLEAMVELYDSYSEAISAAVEACIMQLRRDLDNGQYEKEVLQFLKETKPSRRVVHHAIRDFLLRKYYFRSWLVVLINPHLYHLGCHRTLVHKTFKISTYVSALVFNVAPESQFDKAEAEKTIKLTKRNAESDCGVDAKELFDSLATECEQVSWTKLLGIFYNDLEYVPVSVTNGTQSHIEIIKAGKEGCNKDFTLVIFG